MTKRIIREQLVHKFHEIKNRKIYSFFFRILKGHYYEQKTSAIRSQMYAIFSAWKMHAREKVLLKKYLKESNMDEQLAYTPGASDKLKATNTLQYKSSHMSASHISGFSSEFGHTISMGMGTGAFSSGDKIEKNLLQSHFEENL